MTNIIVEALKSNDESTIADLVLEKVVLNLTEDDSILEERSMDNHPAVKKFAAAAHEEWRSTLKPEERNKPRMRSKNGGPVADINVSFHKLHPTAQKENIEAGKAAIRAVTKHPNNMEAAAEHVHKSWMKRNPPDDYNKHLHVAYSSLPEHEKEKDRAHVRKMKSLLGHS